METRSIVLAAALTGISAGCVPVKKTEIKETFNPDEARYVLEEGDNTVKGSALIRRRDGIAVTCAGAQVDLFPVNDYSAARMAAIYGNTERGYGNRRVNLPEPNREYLELQRTTICDPQGHFTFTGVPDGHYFVTTMVTWKPQYVVQGGPLMKKVTVSGGETVEFVLTP